MSFRADASASQTHPEFHLVRLSGSLAEEVKTEFQAALTQALQGAKSGVLLDMAGVSFVSSAGLGVLTAIRAQAQQAGKHMALCRLPPSVYKTFKLCTFDRVFHLFDDETAALKALAKMT